MDQIFKNWFLLSNSKIYENHENSNSLVKYNFLEMFSKSDGYIWSSFFLQFDNNTSDWIQKSIVSQKTFLQN